MLPTLSPQEFVAKRRKATLKKRSAAQEHFIDLCRLVGHSTPAEADLPALSIQMVNSIERLLNPLA